MILLRVMAVCFLARMMLASAEVHAQDIADQLRAIERVRLRSLVDADLATARRLHADLSGRMPQLQSDEALCGSAHNNGRQRSAVR